MTFMLWNFCAMAFICIFWNSIFNSLAFIGIHWFHPMLVDSSNVHPWIDSSSVLYYIYNYPSITCIVWNQVLSLSDRACCTMSWLCQMSFPDVDLGQHKLWITVGRIVATSCILEYQLFKLRSRTANFDDS